MNLILSGLEIKNQIGKKIFIEPFHDERLNPNSYNLSLHDELLIYTNEILDMRKNNPSKKILIPSEGFMLEGRSSIGRLGICIHVTA